MKELKKGIEKKLQDSNHALASDTEFLERISLSLVKFFYLQTNILLVFLQTICI